MNEMLINLLTYSAVPVTAWFMYMRLYRRMETEGIFDPPDIQFFLIFTVYAGWAMVLFILLSGLWSDVMYLVLVYLTLVAPIFMTGVTVSMSSTFRESRYHTVALVASSIYVGIYGLLIFLCVMMVVMSI